MWLKAVEENETNKYVLSDNWWCLDNCDWVMQPTYTRLHQSCLSLSNNRLRRFLQQTTRFTAATHNTFVQQTSILDKAINYKAINYHTLQSNNSFEKHIIQAKKKKEKERKSTREKPKVNWKSNIIAWTALGYKTLWGQQTTEEDHPQCRQPWDQHKTSTWR